MLVQLEGTLKHSVLFSTHMLYNKLRISTKIGLVFFFSILFVTQVAATRGQYLEEPKKMHHHPFLLWKRHYTMTGKIKIIGEEDLLLTIFAGYHLAAQTLNLLRL